MNAEVFEHGLDDDGAPGRAVGAREPIRVIAERQRRLVGEDDVAAGAHHPPLGRRAVEFFVRRIEAVEVAVVLRVAAGARTLDERADANFEEGLAGLCALVAEHAVRRASRVRAPARAAACAVLAAAPLRC